MQQCQIVIKSLLKIASLSNSQEFKFKPCIPKYSFSHTNKKISNLIICNFSLIWIPDFAKIYTIIIFCDFMHFFFINKRRRKNKQFWLNKSIKCSSLNSWTKYLLDKQIVDSKSYRLKAEVHTSNKYTEIKSDSTNWTLSEFKSNAAEDKTILI